MAGGWRHGNANLKKVIVFRRAEDWRIIATQLDLHGALLGKQPCPDDIWVRDTDLVLLPKSHVQVGVDYIDLIFTRGIYGILPFSSSLNIDSLSVL